MQQQGSLEDATDRMVRSVMLAGAVPAVLIGLVVLLVVHPVVGLLVAVVGSVGWAGYVRNRTATADQAVLAPLGAVAIDGGTRPRLENLVEGLCAVSGIEEPSLAVVPDGSLNALAVAGGSGATFVLTEGLVEQLGRVELEAVLASLAARVKSGAARYVATALAVPVPGSYRSKLIRDGLGEQSSVRADLAAVDLTRYPPGLIAALAAMDQGGTRVESAAPSSAPLWLADPAGRVAQGRDDRAAVDAGEPLSLRIAVLQEL
jgi:heat shock protein HtpX